jgi:hypothetical protein
MQQNFRKTFIQVMLFGLALVTGTVEALATLGQAPSTSLAAAKLTAPAARLQAVTAAVPPSLYTLHETQLESGTKVREFATPVGVVFAVTWRGPVLPDLGALLGDYFKTFKTETDQARAMGKRGSPVNIERSDLVFNSSGRMRNFFGYTYAPALIPTGVNIKDVLQ